MSLEFWYMFPISMVIATIAMASGMEGATFFTPLFLLALKLQKLLERSMGILFILVGFLILGELIIRNRETLTSFVSTVF